MNTNKYRRLQGIGHYLPEELESVVTAALRDGADYKGSYERDLIDLADALQHDTYLCVTTTPPGVEGIEPAGLSVEFSAVRGLDPAFSPDGVETVNGAPQDAEGFAVYLRNPQAMMLGDDYTPERCGSMRKAYTEARSAAAAVAFHLGCDMVGLDCQAYPPESFPGAYAIEPQRDLNAGQCSDIGTHFEVCDEADATQWALFDLVNCGGGPELLEDYPTRAAAEAAMAALEGGEPLPSPVWATATPDALLSYADCVEGITHRLHTICGLHAADYGFDDMAMPELSKAFALSLDDAAAELAPLAERLRERAAAPYMNRKPKLAERVAADMGLGPVGVARETVERVRNHFSKTARAAVPSVDGPAYYLPASVESIVIAALRGAGETDLAEALENDTYLCATTTTPPEEVAPKFDPLADLSPVLRAWLVDEMGMEPEQMGGGCYALRYERAGYPGHILVTCAGGGAMPGADNWQVGVYRDDEPGESVFDLCSNDKHGAVSRPLSLLVAVTAAVAVLVVEG